MRFCFEKALVAIKRTKAMMAFNLMRAKLAKNGFMSDEEIEKEIAKSRSGK